MKPMVVDYIFFAKVALFSLVAVFVLGVVGSLLMAVVSESSGRAKKKVFLDKCALQLANMGTMLMLCTLPFTLGLWFMCWAGEWLYLYKMAQGIDLPPLLSQLTGEVSLLTVACFVVAALLLIIYRSTWKKMKQQKGAHIFLGLLSTFLFLDLMVISFGVKRIMSAYGEAFLADPTLKSFWGGLLSTPLTSAFWPTVVLFVILSVTAAASMGLIYLLMRRNTDDFGRDYYNYALKYCASWAYVSALFVIPVLGWLCWTMLSVLGEFDLRNMRMLVLSIGVLCLLFAVLAWIRISKADAPLRLKPEIFAGVFLFVLFLALQAYSLL